MAALSIPEMTEVRSVIALAFVTDPLIEWVFPDPVTRSHATASWLGLFVEAYAEQGRVDVVRRDDAIVAVALWRIPADAPLILSTRPALGGLLAALVGSDRARTLGVGLGALAAAHPPTPHAYLHFLAVHPDHQGQGLGHQVVRPGIDAADELGLGAYLETMNTRNVAFYRSLGFDVTSQYVLEPDGPRAFAMFRASKPCSPSDE